MKTHNEDHFEQKFRKAAMGDDRPFESMGKVWDRVESKMDRRRLILQKTLWKQWAIVASVLLIATIGYQVYVTAPATTPETVVPPAVVVDEQTPTTDPSPEIIPEAEEVLQTQIERAPVVAVQKPSAPVADAPVAAETQITIAPVADSTVKEDRNAMPNAPMATQVFPARGVKQMSVASEEVAKKHDPLYVLDGKVTTKEKAVAAKEGGTVVKLDNPLYIINGEEYTEKQLFGPEPTSPYAPLDEQDIESISILQGKEATDGYGRKGKKGVVIITTKTGKPKTKNR